MELKRIFNKPRATERIIVKGNDGVKRVIAQLELKPDRPRP